MDLELYSKIDKIKIANIFKKFEKNVKNYLKINMFNSSGEILTAKSKFDIFSNYFSLALITVANDIDETYTELGKLEGNLISYFSNFGVDFDVLNKELAFNAKNYSEFDAIDKYFHSFSKMCFVHLRAMDYKNLHDFFSLKRSLYFFFLTTSDLKKGLFDLKRSIF
ncbi:hypothetical protein [Fibrella arboris]|uniref:hypothetical protein n=1 Tax=Fibrella arboris TaxID=3242486 RepID=UPI0035216516